MAQVWNEYMGKSNPKTYAGKTYYNFKHADSNFFVLDFRSYSEGSSALGSTQKQALKDWMMANNASNPNAWSFICTPVAFTTNIDCGNNQDDCWQSYSSERQEIIDFLADYDNVVILSGGEHFSYAVEVGAGLWEFSTSPMGAYPEVTQDPFKTTDDVKRWIGDEDISAFGGFSTWISIIDVDSTVSPPTIVVTYYHGDTVKSKEEVYSIKLQGADGTDKVKAV